MTQGLSLRGGGWGWGWGWGFPLATMNVAPWYFHRKREEKKEPKEIPGCFIPRLLVVFMWHHVKTSNLLNSFSPFHPYYFTGHLPSPSSTTFCYTHILQMWPQIKFNDFTVISTVFISGYKLIVAISRDPKL